MNVNRIFCRHGLTYCRWCRVRERALDVLNLVLYALAVGICLWALFQSLEAYAVVRCRWVWINNEPVWLCEDVPSTPSCSPLRPC